ncbi:hypothetical protein Tco_0904295, partial [Tanacetum coccineum]
YAVAEGRPVRQRRLPCCGIGVGWLFLLLVVHVINNHLPVKYHLKYFPRLSLLPKLD